jgi:hypothetical protein
MDERALGEVTDDPIEDAVKADNARPRCGTKT